MGGEANIWNPRALLDLLSVATLTAAPDDLVALPNPMTFTYTQSILNGPLSIQTVPFSALGEGGWSAVIFGADGVQHGTAFTSVSGSRSVWIVDSDPLISETNALATVQFVIDNSGSIGQTPSFNSVSYKHLTDEPTLGSITASFDTVTIFAADAEVMSWVPSAPTAVDAYGYRWRSLDATGTVFNSFLLDGNFFPPQMIEAVNPPPAQSLISREWAEANVNNVYGPARLGTATVLVDGAGVTTINQQDGKVTSVVKKTDRAEDYYLVTLNTTGVSAVNDIVPYIHANPTSFVIGDVSSAPLVVAWQITGATTIEFQVFNSSSVTISTNMHIVMSFDDMDPN